MLVLCKKITCVNVYVCLCACVCRFRFKLRFRFTFTFRYTTLDLGPRTWDLGVVHRPCSASKFIGKENHVCESVSVSVCASADSDVQIQTIDADH